MILIGLTGCPGAGKSLAARYMENKGAVVLSGDEYGRLAVECFPSVLRKLTQRFGKEILREDRTLDRRLLGRMVFGKPARLADLNRIVHPFLLRLMKSKIAELRKKRRARVVVVDAALIFEWGIESWFDKILVIAANRELRIRRLAAGGLKKSEAEARMKSQISQKEKIAKADFTIYNNAGKVALRNRVYSCFDNITSGH